jgi:hypothetical protein
VTYTNLEGFLKRMREIPSGHHAFYDVPMGAVRDIEKVVRGDELSLYRISLYVKDTGSLVVCKPSEAHRFLCKAFDAEIRRQVSAMGPAAPGLNCSRSAAFAWLDEQRRLIGVAQADLEYAPAGQGSTTGKLPAVLVEVASSETWDALYTKANAWFRMFEGSVRTIVLVREHWDSCTIGIEVWSDASGTPRCVQSATISPREGRWQGDTQFPDPNLYAVKGGGIRLGFGDIFGRQPTPDSGEEDIVFGEEWLKHTAMETWIAERIDRCGSPHLEELGHTRHVDL